MTAEYPRIFNHQKIKTNIEKLMKLNQEYNNCKEKVARNNVIVSFPEMSENYKKVVKGCKEEKDALMNFLNSLSIEEIIEMQSIMYAGRDYVVVGQSERFITLDEQYKYFIGETKEGAIHSMIGKVPLNEYLIAGLKYYNI